MLVCLQADLDADRLHVAGCETACNTTRSPRPAIRDLEPELVDLPRGKVGQATALVGQYRMKPSTGLKPKPQTIEVVSTCVRYDCANNQGIAFLVRVRLLGRDIHLYRVRVGAGVGVLDVDHPEGKDQG